MRKRPSPSAMSDPLPIAYALADGEYLTHRRLRRTLARRLSPKAGRPVRLERRPGGLVRLYSPKGQPWAAPFWDCRPAEVVLGEVLDVTLAEHGVAPGVGPIMVNFLAMLLHPRGSQAQAEARSRMTHEMGKKLAEAATHWLVSDGSNDGALCSGVRSS